MNLMGIGVLELLVILLVAFLALGPSRSISMARTAGKVMSDLRRTFTEVAAAASAGVDQISDQPAPAPARRAATPTLTPMPTGQAEEQEAAGEDTQGGTGEPSAEQPAVGEGSLAQQPTAGEGSSAEQPVAGQDSTTEQPTAGEDSPPGDKREDVAG